MYTQRPPYRSHRTMTAPTNQRFLSGPHLTEQHIPAHRLPAPPRHSRSSAAPGGRILHTSRPGTVTRRILHTSRPGTATRRAADFASEAPRKRRPGTAESSRVAAPRSRTQRQLEATLRFARAQHVKHAATEIQRTYRGHFGRSIERLKRQVFVAVAIRIQRWFRRCLIRFHWKVDAARLADSQLQAVWAAARRLQRVARGRIGRRSWQSVHESKNVAAVKIQMLFRRHRCKNTLSSLVTSLTYSASLLQRVCIALTRLLQPGTYTRIGAADMERAPSTCVGQVQDTVADSSRDYSAGSVARQAATPHRECEAVQQAEGCGHDPESVPKSHFDCHILSSSGPTGQVGYHQHPENRARLHCAQACAGS